MGSGEGADEMYGVGYTLENKLQVIDERKRRKIIRPTIIIRIIAAQIEGL